MKMIAGLIEPGEGEILFRASLSTAIRLNKQRLGYVPEEPHLNPHLTSSEYLEMVAQLRGLSMRTLSEKSSGLLSLFSLYQDRNVPISSSSKGMRRKVLLAAALLHNPDLMLLDERFLRS